MVFAAALLPDCPHARAGDGAGSEQAFELAAKVVVVKAAINGKGPYRLILDTGATETVITPPVAKALGVNTLPAAAGQRKGVVRSLAVGDAAVTNFGVYVFDPPQALSLRLEEGLDYHGLLGYTFISRFLTTVDYPRGVVRFAPLPLPRQAAAAAGALPFEVVEHMIRVPVRINGAKPFSMLLDTGAAEVLLFPALAQALKLPAPTAASPGPTFPLLASVAVGPAETRQVRAVVDTQADPRVAANVAGILGYPFLSHFTLTLNCRDRLLSLTPPAGGPASAK